MLPGGTPSPQTTGRFPACWQSVLARFVPSLFLSFVSPLWWRKLWSLLKHTFTSSTNGLLPTAICFVRQLRQNIVFPTPTVWVTNKYSLSQHLCPSNLWGMWRLHLAQRGIAVLPGAHKSTAARAHNSLKVTVCPRGFVLCTYPHACPIPTCWCWAWVPLCRCFLYLLLCTLVN